MDLFVHMYDVYGEYHAPLDDRLAPTFRNHDFHFRLREFTLDGELDVLSHVFPENTPRPSRLTSLSITRFTTLIRTEAIPAIMDGTLINPPVLGLLVESSSESIRRLSISTCILDLGKLPAVRQLTHLSLTEFDSHPTIHKLLSFLRSNPGLEELLLNCGKLRPTDSDGGELPLVSFTRLRRLWVTSLNRTLNRLVECLHITSEVEEVELTIDDLGRNQGPMSDTIRRWFDDVVSPRAVQCIEARPSIFRPGVRYIQKSDNVQHPNLPHHSTFVELRFGSYELPDFLSLQVLRNATRLELFHDNLRTSRYLAIFEAAPVLQELVVWAGGGCNSVRALLPTAQDSEEVVGGRTYLSYVPLPNLSHLRIIEAELGDIEDDDGSPNGAIISDLVRQRKLLGLGLGRLELIYCNHVSSDLVEELRSLVPEVFWDGRDGAGEVHSDASDEEYYPSSEPEDSGGQAGVGEVYSDASDEDYRSSSFKPEDSDSECGDSSQEPHGSDEEDTSISEESTDWVVRSEVR